MSSAAHPTVDASLQSVLDRFEELRPEDGWSCDGGAAVLSDMLGVAGVLHKLRCGKYWLHSGAQRYAALGDTDEFEDEHHHWVEVGPYSHPSWLIDPNGEIRDEPRIQAWAGADRYEPCDDPDSSRDREFMSWSPLWDPDVQDLASLDGLTWEHYDLGVRSYLRNR